MTIKNPIISFILYVILPGTFVVLFLNSLLPQNKSSLKEESQKSLLAGNYEYSEKKYAAMLDSNALNIETHRGFITAHFSQPLVKGKNNYRDDTWIIAYYDRLIKWNNPVVRDLGYYGRGLIESHLNHYSKASEYYSHIINQRLPYFNNSYGYVLFKAGNYKEAEKRYWQEIRLNGNKSPAVINLTNLFTVQQRYSGIDSLINNYSTRDYVPDKAKRLYLLYCHKYFNYTKDVLNDLGKNKTVDGFIAAVLILLIWFFYFILIDIFERERLKYLLYTVFLGFISALICTMFYDFYDYYLHFKINGSYVNDLIYCIFGIGFIEETVKIIPVFLVFFFTKQINESIDFLIYGCISALGFAFMENLLYFQIPGLHTITSRALSAVILHMGLTALGAYGLMLSQHRFGKISLKWFAISFSGACLIHGIYDYFLIGEGCIQNMRVLSFILLLFLAQAFGRMLNNGLNISIFFNKADAAKLHILNRYLSYSLSFLILIQYVIMVLRFNLHNANIGLVKSIYYSWFLIFIIVTALSKFDIEKNRLLPLLEKRK